VAAEKRLLGVGGRGGCGIGDGPPIEVVLRAAVASASVDGPPVEVVPSRPVWRWWARARYLCAASQSVFGNAGMCGIGFTLSTTVSFIPS
jgi:hypothetical protein